MQGMDKSLRDILARYPGKYSARLGIELDGREPGELFRWFLASILYGARISGEIAERTYHEFVGQGIDNPKKVVDSGWDGLVKVLDEGGYTRYDFKTADKLLEVCGRLVSDYGGDLNALHDSASGPEDLQARLMALGKGIGEITVNIFLRELRGVWPKATPALSPLALQAAKSLGLIKKGEDALTALEKAWGRGMPGKDFRDLEAALVQMGIELRRKRAA